MAIDIVGDVIVRIVVSLFMEIFLFAICRVIGWSAIKLVTLGRYPTGMWSKQKKYYWVDGIGFLIVLGIFALIVLIVF